jgi:hypothetical protein
MSPVTTCHGAQSEIDAAPVSDGRGGAFLWGMEIFCRELVQNPGPAA